MQYRQGDVLVELVQAIPTDVKAIKKQKGRIILAEGEATGHAHAIVNRVAKFLETKTGERYLDLPAAVAVQHEEHNTINLPPGKYRVVRQREYSPLEIRQVAD